MPQDIRREWSVKHALTIEKQELFRHSLQTVATDVVKTGCFVAASRVKQRRSFPQHTMSNHTDGRTVKKKYAKK